MLAAASDAADQLSALAEVINLPLHRGMAFAALAWARVAAGQPAIEPSRQVSTVAKLYTDLSGIFDFAIRKRWCPANPCKEVDKPGSAEEDDVAEIRALTMDELDAVLAAAGTGPCRHTPRTLERAELCAHAARPAKAAVEGGGEPAGVLAGDCHLPVSRDA
jgi:hypothetical protein